MVKLVRHIPRDEGLAEILRQQSRSTRDVQRATGTEKARTRDSTIIDLLDEFAVTSSPTVEPSSGWSSVAPPWVAGEYVWKRTTTTYGDGATAVGPALLATGNDGEPGAPGAPGAPGVGVSGAVVTYQASASGTVTPTGSWLAAVPTVPAGQYLWTRTVTTYTNATTTTSYSVGRSGTNGTNGTPGAPGANGQTSYLHVAYATNSTGTDGFSPTDPAGRAYMGTYTDFTAADSTNPALYAWSLIKGADGATGGTGPTGTGISGAAVTYQAHTSGTATPTGSWLTSVPAVAAGSFLWTRTIISFTDGASTTTYSVALMGANGSNGTNGVDGRGIASTSVMYQSGTSGTSAPTGTWVASVPAVAAGQFLWTRTVFTYTSGSPATTTEYSVGRMGENGANGAPGSPGTPGSDGRGVTGAVTTYQASASGTAVPTGSWLTNPPAVSPGQFLWSRTVTSYTSGVDTNAYSVARQGATGAPGSAGVSVSSSTMFYWLGATQPAAPTVLTPPAPWSTTEPTYTPGTSSNLYVVVRTVLSSGTFSYSTVSMSASFAAAKSAFGKYTFSASAPVVGDGAGKPVGAMWVRKNGAGEIIGYWEWSGSAWQVRPLSQDIIPLIVAGMISAGAIDGMTITGAEIIAYAGENAARAILKDGALTFDYVGSPGAGTMTLGPGGITSTDSDSRFRISKLSAAPGVGLDILAGTGGEHTASINMDGASGGKIRLNAAKVEFQGDTDWTPLSLGTGWTPLTSDGYEPLAIKAKGAVVEVRGAASKSSWTNWDVLAYIPTALRPSSSLDGAFRHTIAAVGAAQIRKDGEIRVSAGASFVVLSGMWTRG